MNTMLNIHLSQKETVSYEFPKEKNKDMLLFTQLRNTYIRTAVFKPGYIFKSPGTF